MDDSNVRVTTATRAAARAGLAVPAAAVLSNGRYALLLTAAGTGASSCDGLALTAWSRDCVEDREGLHVYLRDRASRSFWSLGLQPVPRAADHYVAGWKPGRFEIERLDDGIASRLEACVAPEAPFEIRRVTIANHSDRARRIEVTTCLEVALQARAAHATHPEFSKLFVQTEFAPDHLVLLARRRPRGGDERHPWLAHAVIEGGPLEVETDRARFVGRGRSWATPRALGHTSPLAGTTGNVLDPVLSLRRTLELPPGASERLTFLLGIGEDRERAIEAVEAWSERRVEAAFRDAEARERRLLHTLAIAEERAAGLHALGAALLAGDPALRAGRPAIGHTEARAVLARHGIASGTPLVLILARRDTAGAAGWLGAGAWWRALGVPARLLVVADDPEALEPAIARLGDGTPDVIARAGLTAGEFGGLAAAARLTIETGGDAPPLTLTAPAPARPRNGRVEPPEPARGARFDEPIVQANGLGGFTPEGDAYVIRLEPRADGGLALPPRPWVNVIANEDFGCVVSETGSITTWSGNSRLWRLTPWPNDPLLDPHGEAFHVRDETDGAWWSPLPGPSPAPAAYEMRHGFGWSACRHESHGLSQETTVFVPRRGRARIVRIRVRDLSGAPRRLSFFACERLVLGVLPEDTAPGIATEIVPEAGATLARHADGAPFDARVAFAAAIAPAGAAATFTCDREAYVGRHRGPDRPAALETAALDGRAGAGLDPCFAAQVTLEVPAGGTAVCDFVLGDAADPNAALEAIARLRAPGAVDAALEEARGFWETLLSGVRVKTPVPALDLMVNGWLGYQTLSCRMWGRTAFYQSGGAYGYRDQLQDAAAMLWLDPAYTRAQIVLHAAHQFSEGDVLHWWHPPTGHGLRTRFADDLLWLPFVTAWYVAATGDHTVLDETVPFLTARALAAGEDEAYLKPELDGGEGAVYEHCCRAIDRSLAIGPHGLPLFGSGDWNDSMNRVGREGRGESVWMAFFLCAVLGDFAPICRARGDADRARRYDAHRARLAAAVEDAAWDGAWYLRGYYDDGTPLGTHAADECRMDALVQAWSILSGAARPERARLAMEAVDRDLVSEREGLIRLLDPPFEHTTHDPGYIRGYLAGVRENGGQYTHAALWVVRAFAVMGRRDRAARLLEMLSPVTRAATAERVSTYGVEPYVVAADVYGATPHVGRGGWTWYTGSAGWMLRVTLESVLGLEPCGGDALLVRPRIPDEWPGFEAWLGRRGGAGRVHVRVRNPNGRAGAVVEARLDGALLGVEDGAARVPLASDGRDHEIEVVLG